MSLDRTVVFSQKEVVYPRNDFLPKTRSFKKGQSVHHLFKIRHPSPKAQHDLISLAHNPRSITMHVQIFRIGRKKLVASQSTNRESDSIALQKMLKTVFKKQRHSITPAISAIQEQDPDVFLDVKTSLQNGPESTREMLQRAIEQDRRDIVRLAIQLGCNCDIKLQDGHTLTTYAVSINDIELLKLLKDRNADFNQLDDHGDTPLIMAVRKNRAACLPILFEGKADIDLPNKIGVTALDEDCMKAKNDEVTRLLLQEAGRIHDKGVIYNQQETPLTYAINNNDRKLFRFLLENHVDCNEPNSRGLTPLNCACLRGASDFIPLLVAAGAHDTEDPRDSMSVERTLYEWQVNFLGAVWGISGDTVIYDGFGTKNSMSSSALSYRVTLQKFPEYLNLFFATGKAQKLLTTTERETIQKAFQTGVDNPHPTHEEMSHIYSRQPLLFIPLSWYDHVISLVIDTKERLLMVCNRGEGAGLHAIERYRYDPDKCSLERFFALGPYFTMEDQSQDDFQKKLQQLLSDGLIQYVGGLDQKMQKAGNCSWASLEAAFLASLYQLMLTRTSHENEAWFQAREIYKSFTSFSRETSLQEFMNRRKANPRNHINSAASIILEIGKKIKKRTNFSPEIQKHFYATSFKEIEKRKKTLETALVKIHSIELYPLKSKYAHLLQTIGALDFQTKEQVKRALEEQLLEWHGFATPSEKLDKIDPTSITRAVMEDRLDILRLYHQIKVNFTEPDEDGYTPMTTAVCSEKKHIVQWLHQIGVDVNASDKHGMTPLLWAIDKENKAMMNALLQAGADINILGPLHHAIQLACQSQGGNGYGMIAFLLRNGAELNKIFPEKSSPLTFAIEMGAPTVVRYLLNQGANPALNDGLGRTPLTLAKEKGNQEIIGALEAQPISSDTCHE